MTTKRDRDQGQYWDCSNSCDNSHGDGAIGLKCVVCLRGPVTSYSEMIRGGMFYCSGVVHLNFRRLNRVPLFNLSIKFVSCFYSYKINVNNIFELNLSFKNRLNYLSLFIAVFGGLGKFEHSLRHF